MTWRFEQDTGNIFDPTGELAGTGYAGGNCGANPEGINNHSMQDIPLIGPIPLGLFTMGEPVEHSQLGPFAIPLIPDPANEMFGRGGFYCHGDTAIPMRASEGCIVQVPDVRHAMWASADHEVEVVLSPGYAAQTL